MNNHQMLFISHSNRDKDIISSLIKALDINEKLISYTSNYKTGAEFGSNIYNWIKERIKKSSLYIIVLSDNYLSSDICKVEWGAIWASGNEENIIPLVFSKYNTSLFFQLHNQINCSNSLDLNRLYEKLKKYELIVNVNQTPDFDKISNGIKTTESIKIIGSDIRFFKNMGEQLFLHFDSRFFKIKYSSDLIPLIEKKYIAIDLLNNEIDLGNCEELCILSFRFIWDEKSEYRKDYLVNDNLNIAFWVPNEFLYIQIKSLRKKYDIKVDGVNDSIKVDNKNCNRVLDIFIKKD